LGSRDVISHVTIILIRHRPFPVGGSFEPTLYRYRLRDIQWRMRRNGLHDLNTTSKLRSKSFILVPIDL